MNAESCVRLTYDELPEVNSERWLNLEDLPGEHWRDCVGFEGKYAVSDYGRVKTLAHINVVTTSRTEKYFESHVPEKIRKLGKNKKNYYSVDLKDADGKDTVRWLVSRLVAFNFFDNPNNYPVVDHISGVRGDNRVENLRFCTQEENTFNSITYKKISANVKKWHREQKEYTKQNISIPQDIIDNASTDDLFEDYYFDNSPRIYVDVDFKDEIWKFVSNTDNMYEVSNYGRVRSSVHRRKMKKDATYKNILRQHKNKNGYYKVTINNYNGKPKTFATHILLMDVFIGRPDNYEVIDHINGNKIDNRIFNLRYVSYKNNSRNPVSIEYIKQAQTKVQTYKRIVTYSKEGDYLKDYDSFREVLTDYPEMTKEQIWNAAQNHQLSNNMQFRYEDDIKDKYANIGVYIVNHSHEGYSHSPYINRYDVYGHFLDKYYN